MDFDFFLINATRKQTTNPSINHHPTNIYFFPEEIIEQILLKLPVEPLLCFKCVCKPWLSIISSPKFIKSHLDISSSSPTILTSFSNPVRFKQFSARSLKLNRIDFPGKIHEKDYVTIVGSCNGLVCVSTVDVNFIWNPCTRIYKKVPRIVEMRKIDYIVYGFGYKESDDDYMVVGVSYDIPLYSTSEVCIYSSRTNSWKSLGKSEVWLPMAHGACLSPMANSGCFFLGKIHFSGSVLSQSYGIFSVDLENEVYETIAGPDYGKGVVRAFTLGVVKGCLCVLSSKETGADLWVMNEYGVKESWCKTLAIPYFKFENHENRWYSTPLIMLPTGEILLMSNYYQFVVYNPKDKSVCAAGSGTKYSAPFTGAVLYVESLVSPIGNHGLGEKINDGERNY